MTDRRPWPRATRYLIGTDGSVIGPNGPVDGVTNERGYRLISVRTDAGNVETHGVHVAVLETFVGPRPDGMQGAHDNGDPGDNDLGNLLWKTAGDNNQDKLRHGTYGKKLTAEQVEEIRTHPPVPRRVLAERYGVSLGMISHIRTGHSWTVQGPSKRRVQRPQTA